MKYLAKSGQLLGACVGDKPSVFLLDPATGTVGARVKIGKGIDALAIDAARGRIVSSNHEGTMTVIGWDGAARPRHPPTTRPPPGPGVRDIDIPRARPTVGIPTRPKFPGKGGGEGH